MYWKRFLAPQGFIYGRAININLCGAKNLFQSEAYAGFSKGGSRKFRKFEINEDQNKNFPAQNQVRFPAQN